MKRKEKKKGKTYLTASNMPPGIPFLLTSLQAEFLKRSFLVIMTAAPVFVFVFVTILPHYQDSGPGQAKEKCGGNSAGAERKCRRS